MLTKSCGARWTSIRTTAITGATSRTSSTRSIASSRAPARSKSQADRTWDVTFQEGSPYRRLIARNGVPLTAEEQKAENEKMEWNVAERRKESKEQRDRRIAEWRKRADRQREPLNEVPDAFDFQIVREEPIHGAAAWVIDGTPKPRYKRRSSAASILQKMKARFWISKRDYHWIKLEAETLDTFTYGAFLLRIGKGAHIIDGAGARQRRRLAADAYRPGRLGAHSAGQGRSRPARSHLQRLQEVRCRLPRRLDRGEPLGRAGADAALQ